MKEWLIKEIKSYIENEIDYIKSDIVCNRGDIKDLTEDLSYLNKLNDEEIKKMAENIVQDEYLAEQINEAIHDQLYQ